MSLAVERGTRHCTSLGTGTSAKAWQALSSTTALYSGMRPDICGAWQARVAAVRWTRGLVAVTAAARGGRHHSHVAPVNWNVK